MIVVLLGKWPGGMLVVVNKQPVRAKGRSLQVYNRVKVVFLGEQHWYFSVYVPLHCLYIQINELISLPHKGHWSLERDHKVESEWKSLRAREWHTCKGSCQSNSSHLGERYESGTVEYHRWWLHHALPYRDTAIPCQLRECYSSLRCKCRSCPTAKEPYALDCTALLTFSSAARFSHFSVGEMWYLRKSRKSQEKVSMETEIMFHWDLTRELEC